MFQIKNYFQKRRRESLVSLFDIPDKSTILDISCGEGDVCAMLHKHSSEHVFHGIDISEKSIGKAQKEHPWGIFSVARAESLPYMSQKFNAVLSCMSLHHYEKPRDIFSEISRVLLPDGRFHLIDLVPSRIGERGWRLED